MPVSPLNIKPVPIWPGMLVRGRSWERGRVAVAAGVGMGHTAGEWLNVQLATRP